MSLKSKAVMRITKPIEKITCILAPNPSAMTYKGTNTYILGNSELAIIDPGPINDEHLSNILKVVDERPVKFVFLTHSHIDHSPLAEILSQELGTPTYAFGSSKSGLSSTMLNLIAQGYESAAEGIDYVFMPDHFIKNGDIFELNDVNITAIHTPGHMGNHMCFQYDKILFSGDHIMDWSTSMISPPYGDLTQFMDSCRLLQTKQFDLFLPGHGDPVSNPNERLKFIINHRLQREDQIFSTISKTPMSMYEITASVYKDLDKSLFQAAIRNVFAHLIDLNARGLVKFTGSISEKVKVIKS